TSHECAPGLSNFLSEFHSVRMVVLGVSLYHHYDREAVRHLFRVAAGLDSMMLGEAEILGQVREAYRVAHEQGATGPVLNRLFQGALEVGKRVRAETELGTRPMSVASAGVKLAERIFGKLDEHAALVLGAGTISEQVIAQSRVVPDGSWFATEYRWKCRKPLQRLRLQHGRPYGNRGAKPPGPRKRDSQSR